MKPFYDTLQSAKNGDTEAIKCLMEIFSPRLIRSSYVMGENQVFTYTVSEIAEILKI